MSAQETARAREHIERLIADLGELRNASTRDPRFKAWRQSSLTLIQLLWPGDPTKSDRFRRVPFSSPSNRMSEKLTREFYERGCAEAAVYLKSLVTEIASYGLPEAGPPIHHDAVMGTAEDDFPLVDLPREGEAALVPASAPSSSKVAHREPSEHLKERSAPRAERRKGVRFGPWVRKTPSKPRLKDMLGFEDSPSVTSPADASTSAPLPSSPAPVISKVTIRPPTRSARKAPAEPVAPPEFQIPEPEAPAVTRTETRVNSATPATPTPAPPTPAPSTPPASERERREAADEFLRTSPVLQSEARPVKRDPRPSEPPALSPTAIALVALAGEVSRLGVPEGQRAGARAALIELAKHLDEGSLNWQGLREAVQFAMQYPDLARRVVPLLIPYLDSAA